MAKRRCAFEGSRFESTEFKELSGFLVHMNVCTNEPVEPPHEAIEGRTLKRTQKGYELSSTVIIRGPLYRAR
jgi:hypothetical protein